MSTVPHLPKSSPPPRPALPSNDARLSKAEKFLEDWRATVDTIEDALAEAYRLSPLQASQVAALMALECETLDIFSLNSTVR